MKKVLLTLATLACVAGFASGTAAAMPSGGFSPLCTPTGPHNTALPALTPTGSVGTDVQLSLTQGSWTAVCQPISTYSYAFYRDGAQVAGGTWNAPVNGTEKYTTSTPDVGHTITASVTACDSQQNCTKVTASGQTTVTSGGGGGGSLCGPSKTGWTTHGYSYAQYQAFALPPVALFADIAVDSVTTLASTHADGDITVADSLNNNDLAHLQIGINSANASGPRFYMEEVGATTPPGAPWTFEGIGFNGLAYYWYTYGSATSGTPYQFQIRVVSKTSDEYQATGGNYTSPVLTLPGIAAHPASVDAVEAYSANPPGNCPAMHFAFTNMSPWTTAGSGQMTGYDIGDGTNSYLHRSNIFLNSFDGSN